jgi:hypothetical protein
MIQIMNKKVYTSYNNCGNCTHNILERIWYWQDHRYKIK